MNCFFAGIAVVEDFFVRNLIAEDKLPKGPNLSSATMGTGRGCNVGRVRPSLSLSRFHLRSCIMDTDVF